MPPLRDTPPVTSEHIPTPHHPFRSIHTEVRFDQRNSYSTLANALGESFLPYQRHSAPPSTHTITPSYSTADAASFGTPIPGPTLPVSVGGPVLSISSGTSATSGQGTAVASPIALNVPAAAEGQDLQGPGRCMCSEPGCQASFTQKKAQSRHFKDKHMPPRTCPECPWFTWPLGRPDKLKAHNKEYHIPSASHD
ncbi:hypothetical protein BGW80DRAFT_1448689 [Lactifluus volemus]|nr:hypothetical protein BGW80DRAFT_1449926 [Lactifluus volemus]KAH9961402.1 hypothetical protein BGW80DRAFT_1448689 [Lactifluus volemus]